MVGPHTFFGFHGNQIRSKPHSEAFRNRLLGYRATEGEFDFAITGHHHSAINQDLGAFEHFGAGSTESGNTYAREWLATGAQQGSQWTLILDDDGIYARHLIRLT